MKKQLATAVFATLALGAVAFAANPFSDVPADHWAYQSVSELAAAGIIDGYPDGTYKGGNEITRYEMAQMTAKAMAHADKADAQQRAVINQLADEFSNELNSLGVRVDNLEKKIGNVKTTGDFRIRYCDGIGGADADKFDMRAQLKFTAQVAEGTQAGVKFRLGDVEFGDNDSQDAKFYEGYISQEFGPHVNVTAGRYNQTIGVTGYWYADHVDGAVATVKNGNFWVQGGYAHFLEMSSYEGVDADDEQDLKAEGGFAQIGYNFGKTAKLQAMYMDLDVDPNAVDAKGNNGNILGQIDNIWGVGAGFYAGDFALTGDYMSVSYDENNVDDADFLLARLQYGKAIGSKVGSWDLWVDYTDADAGSFFQGTGSIRDQKFMNDAKGWGVGADYMMAQNLKLTAYQTFNTEVKSTGNDMDEEFTRVQVSYSF